MNRETLIERVTVCELNKIFDIILKNSLEGFVYTYYSFGHYEHVISRNETPEFSQTVVDNVFTALRSSGYTVSESHDNVLRQDQFKISW